MERIPASEAPVGKMAYAFARAVVDRNFAAAHAMLSHALRNRLGAAEIERDYEAMIAYGDGPPTLVEVVSVDDMVGWKVREDGDIGWAYVAICGANYSEAVSVIVADEGGSQGIRSVEWGRP